MYVSIMLKCLNVIISYISFSFSLHFIPAESFKTFLHAFEIKRLNSKNINHLM